MSEPLSEQVAQLEEELMRVRGQCLTHIAECGKVERERDEWMRLHAMECKKRNATEAALASARVEGARLRAAALALYEKGVWVCDGVDGGEQVRLWEELRDALGLPKGHATALGVAAAPVPETRPAVAPEPPQRVDAESIRVSIRTTMGDLVQVAGCTAYAYITPADARRIVSLAAQDGGSDA